MARSAILAPLFGLALGGLFAIVWLGLERAWTGKAALAVAIIALAAALAGFAAGLAAQRLATWPFAVRFAAALVCLVLATTVLASFGLFVHALWTTALPTDSLAHMVFFIVTMALGAVFSFLGLAAPIVFLPGLPLFLLFALLLALHPR